MAVNTYVALDSATLSTAGVVEFTSIPSTYTDLVVVASNLTSTSSTPGLCMRFNGDTGNNYQSVYAETNNVTAYGTNLTTNNYINSAYQIGMSATSTNPSSVTFNIMSYANNKWKSVLGRADIPQSSQPGVGSMASVWRNTAAITSIQLNAQGSNIATGTFTLYGIKAWDNTEASPKATGGYVYSDSTYWYHAFTFSSTFTPTQSLTADILVVAGGGGGGNANGGGGGGAGGVLGLTAQSLSATGYTVTIGGGGAVSTDGVNSSFASSIALKGARGADAVTSNAIGGSGTYGSGGGTGRDPVGGAAQSGGVGTPGQGYNGGNVPAGGNGGSGGGGAGGNGNNAPGDDSEHRFAPNGDGGIGTNTYASWLGATGLGIAGYIAGGGGGAGYQIYRNAVGGLGGGGRGTMATTGSLGATAGMTNTGSGGGGGGTGAFKSNGMPGGSGLVIVRYAK